MNYFIQGKPCTQAEYEQAEADWREAERLKSPAYSINDVRKMLSTINEWIEDAIHFQRYAEEHYHAGGVHYWNGQLEAFKKVRALLEERGEALIEHPAQNSECPRRSPSTRLEMGGDLVTAGPGE